MGVRWRCDPTARRARDATLAPLNTVEYRRRRANRRKVFLSDRRKAFLDVSKEKRACPGRVQDRTGHFLDTTRTGPLGPHSVHSTQVRSTVRVGKASTSAPKGEHWTGGGPPWTHGDTPRLQQSAVWYATSGSAALSKHQCSPPLT